uniref:Putative secreted protein n=1 Tax=Amblyomma triste TaxID=251400 RepID=A0A023G295_AMBTT
MAYTWLLLFEMKIFSMPILPTSDSTVVFTFAEYVHTQVVSEQFAVGVFMTRIFADHSEKSHQSCKIIIQLSKTFSMVSGLTMQRFGTTARRSTLLRAPALLAMDLGIPFDSVSNTCFMQQKHLAEQFLFYTILCNSSKTN